MLAGSVRKFNDLALTGAGSALAGGPRAKSNASDYGTVKRRDGGNHSDAPIVPGEPEQLGVGAVGVAGMVLHGGDDEEDPDGQEDQRPGGDPNDAGVHRGSAWHRR